MIYTVTFNPALDYILKTDDFNLGTTNRSVFEEITFGGKGINVSYVLSQLGVENTALGLVAGFTGEELLRKINSTGIKTDFIKLSSGNTRINVKIKGNAETEINASGPPITQNDIEQLFKKLENLCEKDVLVLAGSIPKCLPDNIYENILSKLQGKGIRFVVDATGELLLNVLKYNPFLIKPNLAELEDIVGEILDSEEKIISAAFKLKKMGAVNVLVSLGKDGALLIDEFGNVHRQSVLGGKPVNTVGAGDSTVAGFLAGYDNGYEYALRLGVAAGGATACSQYLATKEEILSLLN